MQSAELRLSIEVLSNSCACSGETAQVPSGDVTSKAGSFGDSPKDRSDQVDLHENPVPVYPAPCELLVATKTAYIIKTKHRDGPPFYIPGCGPRVRQACFRLPVPSVWPGGLLVYDPRALYLTRQRLRRASCSHMLQERLSISSRSEKYTSQHLQLRIYTP